MHVCVFFNVAIIFECTRDKVEVALSTAVSVSNVVLSV